MLLPTAATAPPTKAPPAPATPTQAPLTTLTTPITSTPPLPATVTTRFIGAAAAVHDPNQQGLLLLHLTVTITLLLLLLHILLLLLPTLHHPRRLKPWGRVTLVGSHPPQLTSNPAAHRSRTLLPSLLPAILPPLVPATTTATLPDWSNGSKEALLLLLLPPLPPLLTKPAMQCRQAPRHPKQYRHPYLLQDRHSPTVTQTPADTARPRPICSPRLWGHVARR